MNDWLHRGDFWVKSQTTASWVMPLSTVLVSYAISRSEPTRQGGIELVGRLHAQVFKLAHEVGGVVKLELVGAGRVPEDVAQGALEIEMSDHQAVVAVDPDGEDRLARRARHAERGGGQLDLLVGHALDGDLACAP